MQTGAFNENTHQTFKSKKKIRIFTTKTLCLLSWNGDNPGDTAGFE